MQTFLPHVDFMKTAQCLDDRRLGKQRVEAKQIYLAIIHPGYGWQNHPAVNMWRGHLPWLAHYGVAICYEWRRRGFNDNQLDFFASRFPHDRGDQPPWLGYFPFHQSHRSNLLRKDPDHYRRFWPRLRDDMPYYWPSKEARFAD